MSTPVSLPEQLPVPVRLARWLVAAQAVALVLVALGLVVGTIVSTPLALWVPLALAALALVLAMILAWCARSLGYSRAARTPVVMTELLCLPVGYSLGFQAGRLGLALPMLIPAILVLTLLFSPATLRQLAQSERRSGS